MNSKIQEKLFSYPREDNLRAFNIAPMAKTPKNLWILIFSYLDRPKDLGHVSRVCRHWHKISSEKIVWTSLIPKLWPSHSRFTFNEPKAFIKTQISLTPKLFSQEKLSKDRKFRPTSPGTVFTIPQPLIFGNDVFFLEEADGSSLCYHCKPPLFVLKKFSPVERLLKTKCEILNLSLFVENRSQPSIKQIKIFGDIVTLQLDYSSTSEAMPSYADNDSDEEFTGSAIIIVNKHSLSLIGSIDIGEEKIQDYEWAETGYLRLIKEEKTAAPVTYDLLDKKRPFCTIF